MLAAILLVFAKVKARSSISTIDSLQHLLTTTKPDSNKVKLLLSIGDAFEKRNNDYETAKYYYKKAGDLSKMIHFLPGTYNYIFNYTSLLVNQGRYDSALILSKKVYALASQNKDSAQEVRSLFNLGVCYSCLEEYPFAITHFLQAKDYYNRMNKMDMVGMCDNELSILFRNTKQYKKAIKYGKQAVGLYRKYRPPDRLAVPLQNLSVAYQSVQQHELAAPLLKEALNISRKYHNEYDELNILINLVDLMFHQNNIQSIRTYIDRIILLGRTMKIDEAICDGLLNLSRYYVRRDRLTEASNYADSALHIARQTGTSDMKRECFLALSHIAYASHQYVTALKYDEQINLAQQAITSASIDHSVIEFQTKYETVKKVARIKQLRTQQALQKVSIQQKKIYLIIAGGIIALLLVTGLFYYRNHQRRRKLFLTQQQLQRQKITTLEKEKELTATRAVLQGQEEERTRLAKDLHDGLGGILSSAKYSLNDMKENLIISSDNADAFDRTMAMLDKSISELRRVAHNMMPESLINQTLGEALKDFCDQVSANGAVRLEYHDFGMETVQLSSTVKIAVYRVVQELINNIMRHAKASNAIVQLIVKDNMLNLTVEDNGKGFNTDQLKSVEGIGYKNMQKRIAFLKGNMDVRSKADEGTSVYLQIPI